ncbi:MAG TPA: hypothetical protein VL522_11485, partial [Bordetella sp.]|nr:hypothetical protein [Bordetella sp.]
RRATDLPEPEMPVIRTTLNMPMIVARFALHQPYRTGASVTDMPGKLGDCPCSISVETGLIRRSDNKA